VWRREWDSLSGFLYLRSVKGLTAYLIENAHIGIGPRIVVIVAVPSLLSVSSQIECTNQNFVYKKMGVDIRAVTGERDSRCGAVACRPDLASNFKLRHYQTVMHQFQFPQPRFSIWPVAS
jgi:hypothetical protein